MIESNNNVTIQVRELKPSAGYHLKNIKTGDIYEGAIYLGIYDSASNYVEVSESEYQEYLKSQEDEVNG